MTDNNLSSQNKEILEQTFNGTIFVFEKDPVLTNSNRIDLKELGIRKYQGEWTRGMTAKKLLFARVERDLLGIQPFLDYWVLRNFMKAGFYYSGCYVWDKDGKLVGIRKGAIEADWMLNFLSFVRNDGRINPIEMDNASFLRFAQRYHEQLRLMINKYNWRIYD